MTFMADYHVHTSFSPDSQAPPRSCVERAISLDLDEIAITDHMDFKYRSLEQYTDLDLGEYGEHIAALKQEFAGAIKVLFGLELGVHPEMAHRVAPLLAGHPFDFIILSTHDIKGQGTFGRYFENRTKQDTYDEYFREMLGVINARPPYSVYGHMDVIERYGPYKDVFVHYEDHADIIDAIMTALISQGKGLEVNTSGYRYGLGHTNPKPQILRRYKELGGEILTLGSDAHNPLDIATEFPKVLDMLKSLGFKYITRYDKMKPHMIAI